MGKWRYGVILDAGSSGTRVHVYRWLNSAKARQEAKNGKSGSMFDLPKLETKKSYTKKIRPGVSTFGDRPQDVGPEHLQKLLEHALDIVPADQVEDTPIFLMATAGVRLLEPMKQTALLKEICAYAGSHTKFYLRNCDLHIQVIPGATEGLYGWIAANYLLGGFDAPEKHSHGKGHHTYGFLDMGGASAQIAFAPNSTEAAKHADDLKIIRMRTLNGDSVEYKVFTSTWLGFGMNQARQRYVDAMLDASLTDAPSELLDPCLPSGLKTTLKGDIVKSKQEKEPLLIGTGKFKECLAQVYPLLDKDAPCKDLPCLLHGQHMPAIDFSVNHFVGVSEFWHTTHEVFEMAQKDMNYDYATYRKMVMDFCSEDWSDIAENVEDHKWGKKVDLKVAQEVCFKASWLINVLHDGIGIPRVGLEKSAKEINGTKELGAHGKDRGFLDPFQAVDKIDGMEVSWTLGKMVLYAAGQVPPSSKDAGEVGFGNNVGELDFQPAGSNSDPYPMDDDDTWGDLSEDIADRAHAKFSSGFIVFLLMLILVGYIFRKRDRRMRFYRGVNNVLRRNRRPGSPRNKGRPSFFTANKLWGRSNSSHYERVLEDGEAVNEFELGDVDSSDDNENSDSSEGSRLGRTSGLATPKMSVVSFDTTSACFEPAPPAKQQVVGLGLNHGGFVPPNAFARSGLVVRTESRERLSLAPGVQLLGAGRRSRAGSPTRKTSPLMAPLEED